MNTRKQNLEATLTNLVGVPVELTVRGLREFTISCEGPHETELKQAVEKIGANLESAEYDSEIDYAVCFFTA